MFAVTEGKVNFIVFRSQTIPSSDFIEFNPWFYESAFGGITGPGVGRTKARASQSQGRSPE